VIALLVSKGNIFSMDDAILSAQMICSLIQLRNFALIYVLKALMETKFQENANPHLYAPPWPTIWTKMPENAESAMNLARVAEVLSPQTACYAAINIFCFPIQL